MSTLRADECRAGDWVEGPVVAGLTLKCELLPGYIGFREDAIEFTTRSTQLGRDVVWRARVGAPVHLSPQTVYRGAR